MSKVIIIKIATFLAGLYFILDLLFPKYFSDYSDTALNSLITIASLAFGMGIINILKVHGSRILMKQKDSFYSLILILSLVISMIFYSIDWYIEEKNNYTKVKLVEFEKTNDKDKLDYLEKNFKNYNFESLINLKNNLKNDKYSNSFYETFKKDILDDSWIKRNISLIEDGFLTPLGASMFSLLGFYIAVASYRAFRITSKEAALMMISALIVMLGQTSIGYMISPIFSKLRLWLLTIPNAAAFRAIEIGTGVAALILSIRMWLSLDSKDS